MQCTIKKLPKGQIELTAEVSLDEAKPHLEAAAKELTTEHPIPGFRPGNASYDVVKQRYGEMAIYEHALEPVIRKYYVKAVQDNQIMTFGEPHVDVKKLAPGNPIAFTAVVAVVPKVLSLPDLKKIRVKSELSAIEEKEVDKTVNELRKMRTKEALTDRGVQASDKVVLDMDMSLDNVPLEGGQARGHGIYLDEEYYIPGMREALLGLKPGEQKKFRLKFPKEHYQKHLAGRDVDFAVTVKGVYELTPPGLDAEFAKSLGQESIEKLRELLRKNLEEEAAHKEAQRAENEALEKIVERSKFEELPDNMVNQEVERMIHELKHGVVERGLEFDAYLRNIKKTIDELKLEMAPQAVKRVKTALIVREIGDKENIQADDKDIVAETTKLLNAYAKDAEIQNKVRSDEYQEYLQATLRNKKIVEFIKKATIEGQAA